MLIGCPPLALLADENEEPEADDVIYTITLCARQMMEEVKARPIASAAALWPPGVAARAWLVHRRAGPGADVSCSRTIGCARAVREV